MINFVSNLPPGLRSGGFSAINTAAFEALSGEFRVQYVGPINPPPSLLSKVLSKVGRSMDLGGDFFFFSHRRLQVIARLVAGRVTCDANLDFFHGFTPWILTQPKRPYITWSDCTFHDYVQIYHTSGEFHRHDLDRIERQEANWLQGAERVLFTSAWAAGRAAQHYGLDPARLGSVGIFGGMEPPATDSYAGSATFAFIASDFERKGGRVILAAFRGLREAHPHARLVIVGNVPADVKPEPGVELLGFLRKEDPAELELYRALLASARAVVTATRSDITPLILVEAAYFGCPCIATTAFAIPELVVDGTTGILVDDALDSHGMKEAMRWMLENSDGYAALRRAAWNDSRTRHSRAQFDRRLIEQVAPVYSRASLRGQ